jgi:hypothetical protein
VATEHNPYDERGNALLEKKRQDDKDAVTAQWEADLMWQMSGQKGRRVVRHILGTSYVMSPSFNLNALQMAFNEGRRSVGLEMLAVIEHRCPEEYLTMLNEHGGNDD